MSLNMNNRVEIEKIEPDSLSNADMTAISDLIYGTDYDIYSDVFGDIEIARKIIPEMIIKPNGIFSYDNLRIARKDGEIVGVIIFTQNNSFSIGISRETYNILPLSFETVNEKYFRVLSKEYSSMKDAVSGVCLCVMENKRREKIGAMLLHQFVQEFRGKKDIYLDIVADNYSCIKLCTDVKYGFKFEIINTFEDYAKGGGTLLCKTLCRPKDNPIHDKSLVSTPRKDAFHMPGEFETHDGCWMLWPERTDNWRQDAKPAQIAFSKVAEAISCFEPVTVGASARQYYNAVASLPAYVRVIEISYNDAWVRDNGPTFVKNDAGVVRGVDWEFNAWGGLVDGSYFPWHMDDQVAHKICEIERRDIYRASGFVMEGGAIHTDGEGTLFTTEECLLSNGRNPHMTKENIEDTLKEYLGIEKVIWLKKGLYMDVVNGHVDNVLCVVKPGTVMLAWTEDKNDPQYEINLNNLAILEETTDAKGRKLEVIKMPLPKPTFITYEESSGIDFVEGTLPRAEGRRLSASYINFYIANGGIVFPLFNDPNDKIAKIILEKAFPDREIIGVDSREILLGGGNIHCIVQQLPK